MNNRIQNGKTYIVVKPGLVYYAPSALFFVAAYIFYFGLSKAKPSDNIQQDLVIQYGFPLALAIVGLFYFIYYYKKKVIVFDDMVIVNSILGQKRYKWDEISKVVCEHELGMPIIVYSGEQKIFRAEKAYKGYSAIKEVLKIRGLLKH